MGTRRSRKQGEGDIMNITSEERRERLGGRGWGGGGVDNFGT